MHLVGGKGGVGKTTCAAAIAIHAAASGARVLVASTDPAPSLGDALKIPLGPHPKRVPLAAARTAGRTPKTGRLDAVEIDAQYSLTRWLDERRRTLERIAVEGTWLDREDVEQLLRLSLPGVDEIAALLEIHSMAASGRFDLVVVDTAPTGHTLRMLAMPQTLAGVALVFDGMREKRRVMEEALRGAWRGGPEDALIAEMIALARDLSQLLRDPIRTRVSWVTLPEPMAIEETADALKTLEGSGIGADSIIVNRCTPASGTRCGHCDAKRALEHRAVRALPRASRTAIVNARDVEPRGVRALRAIARAIGTPDPVVREPVRASSWRASVKGRVVGAGDLVHETVRLVMFGGKGGVGKTTCAAAFAADAAEANPAKRVVLISTDPAHSLADVFGESLGDGPRTIPRGPQNLCVGEINAAAFLSRIRERYISTVDRMFGGSDRGIDIAHDRAVLRSLIDLAPPGLDEVAAVLEISDALLAANRTWDLVVLDTAPTGHALRLLQMPALIHEWTRALMKILLKYQTVTGLGELAESLVNLSTSVRRLRRLLADDQCCAFIAVTRPAALPRLETIRLMNSLSTLGVHVPALVINAVGRGMCARCRRHAAAEEREIAAIRKTRPHPGLRVVIAGTTLPPPHGVAALRRWRRSAWRTATGYHQDR